MTTQSTIFFATVGVTVIFEFEVGTIEKVEDSRVTCIRRGSSSLHSGYDLIVFPATRKNLVIAEQFKNRERTIYETTYQSGLNWPDIHDLLCKWSHEVMRDEMLLADAMVRVDRLESEITRLRNTRSSFGFKLLR